MKKAIIKLFFLGGVAISMLGCFPEDKNTYDGPTVVEFKNHLFGKLGGSLPAGVLSSPAPTVLGRNISVAQRGTDTIYVQLVGPQSSSATEVNYTVATTNTAVEGTNYNFRPVGARKMTIPANSSVGYLLVDVIPGSVPTSTTRSLAVTLVGNGTVKASENYKTFTLTLRP
ncbi:hypothetical protein [Pedobacter nanyangensis]|uniref:hypothetical protein n=1 Tax=Pedobacter nanyangensis TaxID=1562389 RepID=UPI000DE41974|nr:hypothetical protein [Pedobacter nanyangensis]